MSSCPKGPLFFNGGEYSTEEICRTLQMSFPHCGVLVFFHHNSHQEELPHLHQFGDWQQSLFEVN